MPPSVLSDLVLKGSGLIREPLEVSLSGRQLPPGTRVRWFRDGQPLAKADGYRYVPLDADDGCDLTCAVTEPWGAWRFTPARTVRRTAPKLLGEIFDEIFDQGDGIVDLPTAHVFAGAGLRFLVEGAGTRIDEDTGVLRIDTSDPVDGAPIHVTARNSGGAVTASFLLTVEECEMLPGFLPNDAWDLSDQGFGNGTLLTIARLPDCGCARLDGFELRIGKTAPVRIAATATGAYPLPSVFAQPGTSLRLRALTDAGPGPWSEDRTLAATDTEEIEPPAIERDPSDPALLLIDPGVTTETTQTDAAQAVWTRDGLPVAEGATYRISPADHGTRVGVGLRRPDGLVHPVASEVVEDPHVWESVFDTPDDLSYWTTTTPFAALSHVTDPKNPVPAGTGALRIETLDTPPRGAFPEAYLDFEVEPRTRYALTLTLSDKTHGALSRFRVGIPGDPSLNTQLTNGKQTWAKSGGTYSGAFGARFVTEQGQRILRLSLMTVPNPGAYWDYTAIRLENLDAGPAPRPLDGGGGIQAQPEEAATYYVDYERGDNAADGLSPGTAFRTVPPLSVPPGSTLVFRGGVRYREQIRIRSGGRPSKPVVLDLTGQRFGAGPAVIEGSAPLTDIGPAYRLNGVDVHAGPWNSQISPLNLVLFQKEERIVLAQYPSPSDLAYPNQVKDFQVATAMTRTTVTSPVFAQMHAVEDLTLNTWVRVPRGGAQDILNLKVIAFDGHETVTLESEFSPGDKVHRWRFAVANHPACLTRPGQFIQSADGARIIIRPHHAVADPARAFSSMHGNGNLIIRASHVTMQGGIIEKTRGFGIRIEPPGQGRLSDVVVDGTVVRHVLGNRNEAILMERTDNGLIRNCTVHYIDGSGMRGIRLVRCTDCVVLGNRVDACYSTLLGTYYDCARCYLIGNEIGNRTGKHGNGITVYWGCHDITIAFNRVRPLKSAQIGITSQNINSSGDQRGLTIVFNEIISGQTAMGLWGQKASVAGWPEKGRNFIANNTTFSLPGSAQYGILFLRDETAMDSTVINNLVPAMSDPMSGLMDQRVRPVYGIDTVRMTHPGRGYEKGDEPEVAGFPTLAKLRITAVDENGAIKRIKLLGSRNNRTIPASLSELELQGGSGQGGRVDVTVFPTNLRLRTRNYYHGDAPKYRLSRDRMRAFGDIASYPQISVADHFVNVTDENRENWDLRPGKLDVSRGHEWVFTLPRDKFPTFPEGGIRVSHVGRYRQDGSDVWDWRNT